MANKVGGGVSAPGPAESATDPAALASLVLAEEAKRQAAQSGAGSETPVADDLLPGVGDASMPMRGVVERGGSATLVILSLVHAAGSLDRVSIQVLAADVQDTLGMSDGALGVVAGLSVLCLALGAVPVAHLADTRRRAALVALPAGAFAAGMVLVAVATATWHLAAALALTGLGRSSILPVHHSLLADSYPVEGRARVFAVHWLCQPAALLLGAALAGGIAAFAGGDDGWRWAFVALAIPAAVLAFVARALPEPERGHFERAGVPGARRVAPEEARVPLAAALARLRRIRTLHLLAVGFAAMGFALFGVPFFLTCFLEEHHGLSAFERGTVLAVAQFGAVAGGVAGGVAGDRLFRRSPRTTVLLVGAGIAAYGVVAVAAVHMPDVVLLAVLMAVAEGLLLAALVNAVAVVAAVVPLGLRSRGYALVGVHLFLFGAFAGLVVTGFLSDAHNERAALSIVVLPSALVGGALAAYGARHVRTDMSLVVHELREERGERPRATGAGSAPVLEVRHLDFSYGAVQVLFDVSIDVHEGEIVALLGTNGAGKSTLMRALSGLAPPDRGVVRLAGRPITYADAKSRVRMGIVQVPSGKAVFPSLTVDENLTVGTHLFGSDRARVASKRAEVLGLFPALQARLDQPAGTLSGGEQQMLALAKGLLLEPTLLMIDELSLGLAPVVVQELLGIVEGLRARGTTILLIEQSANVALSIADRAIFMEKGTVRFEGPASQLAGRDDLVRAVFLGGPR